MSFNQDNFHSFQINGTACAVPRMLIALMETNQQKVVYESSLFIDNRLINEWMNEYVSYYSTSTNFS